MPTWISLQKEDQIDQLVDLSFQHPIAIFKHSTSCSISSMAKLRLESSWEYTNDTIALYFLDLLKYRNISNLVADRFEVHHESPQLLIIHEGECIYDGSHFDIKVEEVQETLEYHKLA